MKKSDFPFVALCIATITFCFSGICLAQVNSGSNGSDGALNPASDVVIDMTDHPAGIYNYTSVNISNGVRVTFIPNANNTPVVWLVQSNCLVNGIVSLSGQNASSVAGLGGPGGFRGGDKGSQNNPPTSGQGPGGGLASLTNCLGGNASYGTAGGVDTNCTPSLQQTPGQIYGNTFLIPLIGGSGGGGNGHPSVGPNHGAGGGGGGAILIAASGFIELNGTIESKGGSTSCTSFAGGGGSGGSVRLVATVLKGVGTVNTAGGIPSDCGGPRSRAGDGRVRLDGLDIQFSGNIFGESSRGYQPIILQTPGQGTQLKIVSIAGAPVPPNPSNTPANPAVIIPGQQGNPIVVVVQCSNIPLNTPISVTVCPVNGSCFTVSGNNDTGTIAASTARVSLNMPRGGGIAYASTITVP